MHQDFPRLFAEISVDGAGRDELWKGVFAFAQKYERAKAEVLVRLAFGTKAPAAGHRQVPLEQALAAFHKSLSDAYPSFEPGGRLDQILAAAALLQLFDGSSVTAMAVTTTACGVARQPDLPIDLVTLAENAISCLAASRRIRPNLATVKVELPEFEFEVDLSLAQPNQPQTFKAAFDQFRDTVNETLVDLVERLNEALGAVIGANKMADEELDMLSWVFAGRALIPDKAFEDVAALEKPLVMARDLASLTKIYPGPNAVLALLSRAGVDTVGEVTIVDAVNAVSQEWTAAVLKGRDPSPASSPIHLALVRREETEGGDGWQAGWAAVTGVDVATALSPIRLAELFYREILWLR
jgi:hypothetical protein